MFFSATACRFNSRPGSARAVSIRIAYATFALAWLFLCSWIWHAVASPLTAMRVTSALYFLPFCGLFFLIAFYNALLNFQIRTGRLASWRAYLATTETFCPRREAAVARLFNRPASEYGRQQNLKFDRDRGCSSGRNHGANTTKPA